MRNLNAWLAGVVSVVFVLPVSAAIPKATDVPPLVKELQSAKDPKARANAAKELGHIGEVKKILVKDAIPALLEAAKDKNADVKIEALLALSHIGFEPEKVLALVMDNLKSKEQKILLAAIQAAGYLGSAAEDAVPELNKIAKDNEVPRNRKEAEMKFTREELQKRNTLNRAVGDAKRAIGGR